MAEIDTDKKIAALEERPRLSGRIVSQTAEVTVIQSGGLIAEISSRHIAERTEKEGQMELVLAKDAEIIVSASVSVQKGFVADNVFGSLVPGILACACNCNCNCDGNCNCNCNCNREDVVQAPAVTDIGVFRRPFTGGARER